MKVGDTKQRTAAGECTRCDARELLRHDRLHRRSDAAEFTMRFPTVRRKDKSEERLSHKVCHNAMRRRGRPRAAPAAAYETRLAHDCRVHLTRSLSLIHLSRSPRTPQPPHFINETEISKSVAPVSEICAMSLISTLLLTHGLVAHGPRTIRSTNDHLSIRTHAMISMDLIDNRRAAIGKKPELTPFGTDPRGDAAGTRKSNDRTLEFTCTWYNWNLRQHGHARRCTRLLGPCKNHCQACACRE